MNTLQKNDRFQKFIFSKEKLPTTHTHIYKTAICFTFFSRYTIFEKVYPIDFKINWHSKY